jgi:septal ring factor EnvC (AmiA/AmiB activator)
LAGYRWPARGRIVENWGANQGGGQIARGLTIEPREAAGVVAPFEGIVAFAGQFRGYGLILILEHSGGYHSILAQMGRIDAVVGQAVTAGEPVGRAGASERGTPVLYIELRRNGLPIDPSPLLFGAEAGLRR